MALDKPLATLKILHDHSARLPKDVVLDGGNHANQYTLQNPPFLRLYVVRAGPNTLRR
jgi:hypothetical protein